MNASIVSILAGISGLMALLSVLAYFSVRRRPVEEVFKVHGQVIDENVIKALQTINSDEAKIKFLKEHYQYQGDTAKQIVNKSKQFDPNKNAAGVRRSNERQLLITAVLFGVLALVGLIFAINERGLESGTKTPTATQEPVAVEKRRIILKGPKPLYAPISTGAVFQECTECPEMIAIAPRPTGFTIGNSSERRPLYLERPYGPISLSRPFAVSKFEITVGQFRASGAKVEPGCYATAICDSCYGEGRDWQRPGFAQKNDHPVVCMNWDDANKYVLWLNDKVNGRVDGYRLPTEVEWEYAARAETPVSDYWGNQESMCSYGNVADKRMSEVYEKLLNPKRKYYRCDDGFIHTGPVGQFLPNPWGFRDMLGNVEEWTEDCFTEQYNDAIKSGGPYKGPRQDGDCFRLVARGGAWVDGPELSVFDRSNVKRSFRTNFLGFRVARFIPE
jgi:formylglycine-generating enzyme